MTPVRVSVAQVRGSAPREVGAAMVVFTDRLEGTIGGGALELEAVRLARANAKGERGFSLGPSLGQCCGGHVTLRFEPGETVIDPPPALPALPDALAPGTLWVWGAGHVGRAVMADLGACGGTATWVDSGPERFPDDAEGLPVPGILPALKIAPDGADHLVFTYSHDIDLALIDGLLRRRTGYLGLIGSATKWARFRARLLQIGHTEEALARVSCPIGDPSLGKHPAAIARGVIIGLDAWRRGGQT